MPSGADLEMARMLKAAGIDPLTGQGYDGAFLEQLGDIRYVNAGSDGASPYVSVLTDADCVKVQGTLEDAAPFLNAFFEKGYKQVSVVGVYHIYTSIIQPHTLEEVDWTGAEIIVHNTDTPGIRRLGSYEFLENIPSTVQVRGNTFKVTTPSLYTKGDWVLIGSQNQLAGTTDKIGTLRCITGISGDTVTVDRAFSRQFSSSPRVGKVLMAPPIINRKGKIRHFDRATSFSSLINYSYVLEPDTLDMDIGDSGATGVNVTHCVGGRTASRIHDLLDDDETHFGYGINIAGCTRDHKASGSAYRVRHAVTTNTGPNLTGLGFVGDPENNYIDTYAYQCSNKSLDTHRVGYGNVIVARIEGGGGGVQVRSDNTTVIVEDIRGCTGDGVFIAPNLNGRAKVFCTGPIRDIQFPGAGIRTSSPTDIYTPDITIANDGGLNLSSDCRVFGGRVSTVSTGIIFRGSNSKVYGVIFLGVTTLSSEVTPGSGNYVISYEENLSVSVPVGTFTPNLNTPSISNINGVLSYAFDSSIDESICGTCKVPSEWKTFSAELVWSIKTNSSGNVVWKLDSTIIPDTVGGSLAIPNPLAGSNIMSPSPAVANTAITSVLRDSIDSPSDGTFSFIINRLGSNVSDTLAIDSQAIQLILRRIT